MEERWLKVLWEMKDFCAEQEACEGCPMEKFCRDSSNQWNPMEWRLDLTKKTNKYVTLNWEKEWNK